jgi:hypothetical protein
MLKVQQRVPNYQAVHSQHRETAPTRPPFPIVRAYSTPSTQPHYGGNVSKQIIQINPDTYQRTNTTNIPDGNGPKTVQYAFRAVESSASQQFTGNSNALFKSSDNQQNQVSKALHAGMANPQPNAYHGQVPNMPTQQQTYSQDPMMRPQVTHNIQQMYRPPINFNVRNKY